MIIKGTTQVYAIFGHPVSHSKSPAMHNAAFRHLAIDACYIAFDVEPHMLKEAVYAIRALNIKGLNITIPHKESVLEYLDQLSPEAEVIGAVNTIKNQEGSLLGFNTDGRGFIQSLTERGISVCGKKVLVLGAGGASKAVVYSLLKEGAEVFIYNRTLDKALALIRQYQSRPIELVTADRLSDKGFVGSMDIVVNTTSVGLQDNEMPIAKELLLSKHVVCDLIYHQTLLLKSAAERGCVTIDGSGMLLWQGVYAFEIWTGQKAPVEVMREALLSDSVT